MELFPQALPQKHHLLKKHCLPTKMGLSTRQIWSHLDNNLPALRCSKDEKENPTGTGK